NMAFHSRPSPKSIPRDTYVDLVDSLFGTTGSFYAGVLAGLIAPAVAYARTGALVFIGLAATMVVVTGFRIAVMRTYRANAVESRRAKARRWEMLYAVGAISFMLTVGATGAILFRLHADQMSV